MEVPEETILDGYADDVGAQISARLVEKAQEDQPIDASNGRLVQEHYLSLALAKTELVILTKQRMDTVNLVSKDGAVTQATQIGKYLLKEEFLVSDLQNGR